MSLSEKEIDADSVGATNLIETIDLSDSFQSILDEEDADDEQFSSIGPDDDLDPDYMPNETIIPVKEHMIRSKTNASYAN